MHVVMVDAKNALYRFGWALKNLKSSDGQMTGAVHGFMLCLLRLKKHYPDSKLVVVWDGRNSRQGWRSRLFAEYKQNRAIVVPRMETSVEVHMAAVRARSRVSKMALVPKVKHDPDELKGVLSQEDCLRSLLTAIGVAQAYVDLIEADDIIGILCSQTHALSHAPVVYSTDQDFYQLVPWVAVVRDKGTPKKLTVVDLQAVAAEFRCRPEKVTRVRALAGDPSDGIPNVIKGIGKVKAAALVVGGVDPAMAVLPYIMKKQYPAIAEQWANVHRNYRLSRLPQSARDAEFSAEESKMLEHEVGRILGLLMGKVKASGVDRKAFLSQLSDLELTECIGRRHEFYALAE